MEKTVKTTTFAKALVYNAGFTTKYLNKTQIGEEAFKAYKEGASALVKVAYTYYETVKAEASEEAQKEAENKVYSVLRENVLSLIGKIPSSDEMYASKINAKRLFLDIIASAVKRDARDEVEKLISARSDLTKAKADYRKACFTKDGYPIQGLSEGFAEGYIQKVKTASAKVERLLEKSGNSVHADIINADKNGNANGAFLKALEISLKKEVKRLHDMTASEAKAEEKAKDKTRKANRKPKAEAKPVK